jgi:putative transposase
VTTETSEEAMQSAKGRFSFRLKRELGYLGEVWQQGFSEVQVEDRQSFLRYRQYIAESSVKARLVDSPERFPYCFTYLAWQGRRQQGLKPAKLTDSHGMAEAMP